MPKKKKGGKKGYQCMPFKKMRGGKYKSPSCPLYTKKQMMAYHASGGWKRKKKNSKKKH